MSIAQSTFSGTVMKVKEVPFPLSVRFEEIKKKIEKKFFVKNIDIKNFIIFLRQISVMTNAGIPLRESLFEGMNSTEDKFIKDIGKNIIENIDSGKSLTKSFKEHEEALGLITISLVELGEQTGSLSESFGRLAEILEEIDDNRTKIKKAMRMPLISLGAMGVAFVTLIMLVVPKFESIFKKMGGELPLPTKILMGIEYGLSNFGFLILLSIFVVYGIFQNRYKSNEKFKLKIDEIVLKTYLLGSITSLGMYSRFMMILSELIRAGIPLSDALTSAEITIENSYIKKRLQSVSKSIQRGHSLAESFEETKLFENMAIQMVKAGESGGEIDTMLEKIADYYKGKFQNLIDNLSTLIEPIMMGLISILVLILALGIFLPMWELSAVAMG